MTVDWKKLTTIIGGMDRDELRRVYAICKVRENGLTELAAQDFSAGDKVSWPARDGTTVKGAVLKVARKTVRAQAEDGRQWKVHISLLTKED